MINPLELLVLFIVITLVFKPKDLPRVAKQLGKLIGKTQKVLTPLENKLHDEIKTQLLNENIARAERAELQNHD